jgi:hypothetical protein
MSVPQRQDRLQLMGFLQAITKRYHQLHTTRVRLWLGSIIIVVAAAFTLALHPVSGFLGGIFIVLLGWAVPSVLNILASVLVVAYLPRELGRHPLTTLLIGVIASLVIAVVPAASEISQRVMTPPVVTSNVGRVVTVPEGNLSLSSPPLDVVANPLAQVIGMGSNEGCGCSYWSVIDSDPGMFPSSYAELLSEDLNRRTGGRGTMWSRDARVSIAVVEVANRRDPSRVDIAVTVQDSGKVTAGFREFSVPRYRREFIELDRAPLSSGPFVAIAWHDLTHGTFWSPIIGAQLGYYPGPQIHQFLRSPTGQL